jgi:site-specific recombinase XerD
LRIHEALSLLESDLDPRRGSILVRHGKNDRRREVGMDAWGWSALEPWLAERATLPVGPLFCVIVGPTRGHRWTESAARLELHPTAIQSETPLSLSTRATASAQPSFSSLAGARSSATLAIARGGKAPRCAPHD